MSVNIKNELINKLFFNHKIDLSQAIFIVAAGYSLTHDIDLLQQVYKKYKPFLICVDSIYPRLLEYDIEPNIIANLDHHAAKLPMMETSPGKIDIHNTHLLTYACINKSVYDLYPKERIIEGAYYPVTESVLSLALSYSIIEWPSKYKLILGADLCWQDEDRYYFQGLNVEQGKKNIEVAKCGFHIEHGKDIYGNDVRTNLSFWVVERWISNLCHLVPETVINGSSGPTILGQSGIDIIKKPLKELI